MMRLRETALAVIVSILMVLGMGCLGGEDEPDVKIELTLMGEDAQNVVQGNNTTFLFAIDNLWKDNATLYMSIDEVPDDWSIEFLPGSAVLDKDDGTGVRMNVSVPFQAKKTRHDLKVWAKAQGSDVHRRFLIVTVFPQDPKVSTEVDVVDYGRTVYFNYTGFEANGSVFDTTSEDIAISSSIPKSDAFQPGGTFEPRPFNIEPGAMIPGFLEGVLGMRKGEDKSFFIPDHQAYSKYSDFQINLTETVPLREEWKASEFERAFRQAPAMYLEVKHRKWNWTAQVVDMTEEEEGGTTVVIELRVKPGDVTTTYGWESVVRSVDSTANGGIGEMVLLNKPGDVGSDAKIYNRTAPKEYDFGHVVDITDEHVEVRVQQSHHELAGRDLIFWVKVTDFG